LSEKHPDTRRANGAGHGGPARRYSWPPFEQGNTASLKHGLYAGTFQLLDGEQEIAEIADAVRAALPIYASAFEVGIQLLAGRIWRLKRGYQHVARTPEGELPKSFLESLNALENVVSRTVARLGLDPIAAAELGVNLQRLAAGSEDGQPPFNWSNLDAKERRSERLLAKGRRASNGDGA
jgi:hypothetical protein